MGKSGQKKNSDNTDNNRIQAYNGSILKALYNLSEKEVLDRILEHPAPRQLIQRLPIQDFFWLIKRLGAENSVQLLRFASLKQWQYLLDLELWQKDRLDIEQASQWLRQLQLADPGRLAGWLFNDGQALAYYYLFKRIQVEIKEEDEAYDLEKGFITLDGLFYVKVNEEDQRETIEGLLRTMAGKDLLSYQTLLSGLAGVLPTELEEQMYRLKTVRLAEHGFLPPEEALLVYAPLDPQILEGNIRTERVEGIGDDIHDMAPYSPLYYAEGQNLLSKSLSGGLDPHFLDRIRLEFAGLCNQILSADGLTINDIDVLKRTCRKSAGYLNLILEKICGNDVSAAETLLRKNSLISLFRTGFGLAQKLKWEAERWVKESWFDRRGLSLDFWGDEWGNTLAGLVAKRPQYYRGPEGGGEYRDFEQVSDLTEVSDVLHRLTGLDRIFSQLTGTYPLDEETAQIPGLKFFQLLFTLWARQMLGLEPSFEGVSLKQVKRFFHLLRAGDETPPYQMLGFEEVFVKDFMASASGFLPEDTATLKDTLSLIWQEFCQEYERVPVDALAPRFTKYILIRDR